MAVQVTCPGVYVQEVPNGRMSHRRRRSWKIRPGPCSRRFEAGYQDGLVPGVKAARTRSPREAEAPLRADGRAPPEPPNARRRRTMSSSNHLPGRP